MRNLILRLALLGCSLLLGLVAGELVVRWLRPQTVRIITPGLYVADPPDGYRMRPGYSGRITNRTEYDTRATINSDGMRGPEIDAGHPGRERVLVTGDSFTFGIGVEEPECYVRRLKTELRRLGRPADVLNGGLPGLAGTPDEVRWLERHGLENDPDLIVLGIFVGNDLQDALAPMGGFEIVDGLMAPKGSRPGLKVWLHTHSHLYAMLKGSLPSRLQNGLRSALGMGEPWSQRYFREGFSIYSRTISPQVAAGESATAAALDRLLALTTPRGIRVAALIIPDLVQLDADIWAESLARIGADPADFSPDRPTRIFLRLLADHEIPTLDLTPTFQTHLDAGEALYFPEDRHWTPAGHALAARRLASFLVAANVVGDSGDDANDRNGADDELDATTPGG